MKQIFSKLRLLDWSLVAAVILLTSISLITIYSLDLNRGSSDFSRFYHQLVAFILGLILVLFFSFVNINYLRTYSFILYLIGLGLLIIVLFFGQTIRGTTGWLSFGFFNFQPMELVKVFVMIFLASYFSHQTSKKIDFKKLLISFLIILPVIILIALQPDFGSASLFILIWLALILIIGLKRTVGFTIIISLMIVSVFSWTFIFNARQQERILTFLQPSRNPYQTGYQVSQAETAIGSGQLWGRGLGLGSQSQLHYLPDPETDFIFAVIAEEFGFLGSSLIIILYLLLFYRLFKLLFKLRADFPIYFLILVIILFSLHLFINIGMNIRLTPIMGIPLPFLSYGGSFLVISYLLIALVQSIKLHYHSSLLT